MLEEHVAGGTLHSETIVLIPDLAVMNPPWPAKSEDLQKSDQNVPCFLFFFFFF